MLYLFFPYFEHNPLIHNVPDNDPDPHRQAPHFQCQMS